MHGLMVLRATYGQGDLDNEVVRRQAEDFFKDCRELADWLKRQAGRPEAMSYVNSHPDLMLCDGMAQTTKHHTRTASGTIPTPSLRGSQWCTAEGACEPRLSGQASAA